MLTDPALIAGALVEPRGLYHGKALALVRPGSTAEVAAVAAFCNEARIGIVPQGGNTGLVGGQTPDESGDEIILSTQRLKAIREVDPHADVMICEAGVTLAEAQAAALAADRLFPLSLAAEGTCTIGGNVSTNAGGVTVIAYGNARDLVTGVEAVLADGRIVNALSKLRKDNTGYDVKGLFVGSEGTLGIVTAASLRLFPNPRAQATAFVGLDEPRAGARRCSRSRASGSAAGSRASSSSARIAYDITVRHGLARAPLAGAHPWYVLIEASSQIPDGLDEALRRSARDGVRAGDRRGRGDRRLARPAARILEAARSAFPRRRSARAARSSTTSRSRSATCPASSTRRRGRSRRSSPARASAPSAISATATSTSTCRSRSAPTRPPFLARWDAMNEVVHGDRRAPRRLVLRRARRRAAEARPAGADQGPGDAGGDARDQGGARPERDHEPGQGAVMREGRGRHARRRRTS